MKPAIRVVLPAAGALLAVAGGAALVCTGGQCIVPAVDAAGLSVAHGWRTAWLDGLAASITWAGSLFLLVPLALLLATPDARRRGWRAASFVPLALLSSATLAHLTKVAVSRPRPELFPPLTTMPADASFPSAHAMQVTALVMAYLLRPGARPGIAAWLAGGALVMLVGLSRIHLQVHFPSDVIFGMLAAALLVLALRELPPWRGDAA
jgi:membrane-associated phospholipid phosphatase